MAEIKVEPKKKNSLLPWILGLALLALALWGISRMRDDDGADVNRQGNVQGNMGVSELIEAPAPFLLAA